MARGCRHDSCHDPSTGRCNPQGPRESDDAGCRGLGRALARVSHHRPQWNRLRCSSGSECRRGLRGCGVATVPRAAGHEKLARAPHLEETAPPDVRLARSCGVCLAGPTPPGRAKPVPGRWQEPFGPRVARHIGSEGGSEYSVVSTQRGPARRCSRPPQCPVLARRGPHHQVEPSLRGRQQRLALAGPLGGQQRVAADDEPLARMELRRRPPLADPRGPERGDPPQSRRSRGPPGSGRRSAAPGPPTSTTRDSEKRAASFSTREATAPGSAVLPRKTSAATGRPSRSQSRAKTIRRSPRLPSREWPQPRGPAPPVLAARGATRYSLQ